MTKAVQGAQSFARTIAVLQTIADADRPLGRADLIAQSDLTRPTVYRILASLEAEGLIEEDAGAYRPGARLINLARSALSQTDLRQVAEPELERLRDATGETVHLAVRAGDAMVYVHKIESREVVRMMSTIGTRIPFHSTSVGRAYLSALPEAEARAALEDAGRPAITPHTITGIAPLMQVIGKARALGYAFEDQENEAGIVCFGAPVRSRGGTPAGAISVSVPLFRLGEADRYTRAIVAGAEAISARLTGD